MSTQADKAKKGYFAMGEFLAEKDLDSSDCRMLQNHYANIMGDTMLLVSISNARKMNVDLVYKECKKATIILGNRIKYLSKKGVE